MAVLLHLDVGLVEVGGHVGLGQGCEGDDVVLLETALQVALLVVEELVAVDDEHVHAVVDNALRRLGVEPGLLLQVELDHSFELRLVLDRQSVHQQPKYCIMMRTYFLEDVNTSSSLSRSSIWMMDAAMGTSVVLWKTGSMS